MANELKQYRSKLLAVTATGTTATSSAIDFPLDVTGGMFICDATISGTAPYLDVAIQTSPDDTNYFTIMRFAQFTATASQYINVSFNNLLQAGATGTIADTGGSLYANITIGPKIKVKYTIAGTGPSCAFNLYFIENRKR
jgi:hypothetical protein